MQYLLKHIEFGIQGVYTGRNLIIQNISNNSYEKECGIEFKQNIHNRR